MLDGLPLEDMTKEDIICHLAIACCPVLKKMVKESV
jgi:hypothetical protein